MDRTIAGFFRRAGAELVDLLLLVALGAGLCLILFDPLSRMGMAAHLLGFAIVALYFGAFDSRLGGGRSPGKRLLGVIVVDRTGALLAPTRALLRGAVLGGLFLCNGLSWWFETRTPWIASALGDLGVLLLLSLPLLYLFNMRTRQSLHDLVAGAYVVRHAGAPRPADASRVGVLATCACLLPLAVLFALSAQHLAAQRDPDRQMITDATAALYGREDVVRAHMFTRQAEGDPLESVFIWAWMARPVEDETATASSIASTVRDRSPQLLQGRHVRVRLIRNATLGLFSHTRLNRLVELPDR